MALELRFNGFNSQFNDIKLEFFIYIKAGNSDNELRLKCLNLYEMFIKFPNLYIQEKFNNFYSNMASKIALFHKIL